MINLTATLTTKTVREVMRHLGMKQENTFMVQKSPINENTHLTIMERVNSSIYWLHFSIFCMKSKMMNRAMTE